MKGQLCHLTGQGGIILSLPDRGELVQTGAEIAGVAGAGDAYARVQAVNLTLAIVQQIGAVRHRLQVKAQLIAARQCRLSRAEQIAPHHPRDQPVAGHRPVELQRPAVQRLTVAQVQRAGAVGGDIGCQRQIAAVADGDEIGQFQPRPQGRG